MKPDGFNLVGMGGMLRGNSNDQNAPAIRQSQTSGN